MLDKLKNLLSSAKTPDELAQAIEALGEELKEAQAEATRRAAAHDAKTLEFIGAGDDKGLAKSREGVTAAEAKVRELHSAITAANARLEEARKIAAATAGDAQMAKCIKLLDEWEASVKRLHKAMDQVGTELQEVLDLGTQVWQNMPSRPEHAPHYFTRNGILNRFSHYLFGVTNGRLGHGTNVYVARNVPTMAHQIGDIRKQVLSKSKVHA